METTMKAQPTVSTWVRSTAAVSLAGLLGLVLSAGCSQVEGSRCNPALSHDECDNAPTTQCVQPTAPACNGEAYCCTVDSNGNITDTTDLNCAFLIMCQMAPLEGGAPAVDAGSTPDATPEASESGGGG
jgi:hypothetical protein